jgi:AcrR family transcriptional regulator
MASSDGRATRWAGHRDRRRAEIVSAALAAIDEHGPGVSTEQIAERAGIPRPRLYRHFADADDLHDAIAQRAAASLMTELTPALSAPTGTPRDIITLVVRTFVTWMTDNASLYRYVVLRTSGAGGGEQVIADVRSTVSGMLGDLLARYLVLFTLDPRAADPLAFGLVGMVESATERWLAAPGQLSRDALVAQVSFWVWGVLDTMLRVVGVVIDPDVPLPPLS